ncbi:flagellar basal-body MS-ring/collar protein FliF [Fictibacillus aquaticus]|uniref:Flagellar M-ring protein n=1 Tax=Fictibacillus aquaticus TaxID=2021314 RepID=A0A235FBV0_9BACL|nr:flagellar basal-body MS-ring/collar protein FliF [Fictibacillus aquaticus]OYD58860.1 flagellar M-ring protein FliF [Fictibacillus aquaticus]
MNEKWRVFTSRTKGYFNSLTNLQKGLVAGGALAAIVIIVYLAIFLSKPELVPLYSNLSPQEAGQVQETLNSKGITSELADGGNTILVPAEKADSLKVELAAEGIPKSGNIDFSYFGEKSGFGITDKEFSILEREATQTEISSLIKSINGVDDAAVMITMPEPGVFVSDEEQPASASVVLTLAPGARLEKQHVNALYNLVSKSVPNLPVENIVITDQYSNYYDLDSPSGSDNTMSAYDEQRKIKMDIERDIQRRVQQMLGTIVGHDKVVTTVTADIDFTKEKREENLVEPVDPEKMEGIEVSVERIKETFSGEGAQAGGTAGTGDEEVPNYPGASGNSNGDYEKVEERINNEVNKIRKEIVESPYEIRDIGIQAMVEPPNPKKPDSLPAERLDDIQQILATIVRTTISKDAENPLTDEQIEQKVFVSAQPFKGKAEAAGGSKEGVPLWVYITGGILLLVILFLIFALRKKTKDKQTVYELGQDIPIESFSVPDVNSEFESESTVRKEQLDRMAREKPDEFAKLLRTWLSED